MANLKIKEEVISELAQSLKHLEQNSIEYLISGSLAMNSFMVPRFTRDVDIVIGLTKDSAPVFFSYFQKTFYLNKEEAMRQIAQYGFFNAVSMVTGYKYDFIVQKDLEYESVKFERKKRMQLFGIDAWIISVEDLIISKLQWIQQTESIIQKNDIRTLLEEDAIDVNYIYFWINKLKLKTFDIEL